MKLGFLMSLHRKNSVRDQVIGKKWIYLERNTLQRECGQTHKVRVAPGYGVVSFYKGELFHRLMSGTSIPAILEKGWGFPGMNHCLLLTFMVVVPGSWI